MTDEPVKMEAETSMPTPTIEETAEQKLARGEAPIKKEFLVPVNRDGSKKKRQLQEDTPTSDSKRQHIEGGSSSNEKSNDVTDDDQSEARLASLSTIAEGKQNSEKGGRGKWEKKPKPQRREKTREAVGICFIVATKGLEACTHGERCKFNHDVAAYLAAKPPDLEGKCPSFEQTGECPQGIRCRFGSIHIKDGKNIIDPTKRPTPEELEKVTEINRLSKDLQGELRKKKHDFPKSVPLLQALKKGTLLNDLPSSSSSSSSSSFSASFTTPATTTETETIPIYDVSGSSKTPLALDETRSGIEGKLNQREIKQIDLKGKLYLAPLTTIGNLPYRRICKEFGADITCGEMALATNLLQGQASEWALLKRHPSEDIFGVQLAGAYPDTLTKAAELLNETTKMDFLDINAGCPIDLICDKGAGAALTERPKKVREILACVSKVLDVPLSIKTRIGRDEKNPTAHELYAKLRGWGASWATLHGRSRNQRYSKTANWSYIRTCVEAAKGLPIVGNGDVYSYVDYEKRLEETGVTTTMIARGAIIKPWLFQEIKERRHIDISAQERLEFLKKYANYGLEHWGSDHQGVETTRQFLLNWLSFLHRYIPVGLLEVLPIQLNSRPSSYFGRNDLETLMASPKVEDWVKISELCLGKVPEGFSFVPKHQSNAYSTGDTNSNG